MQNSKELQSNRTYNALASEIEWRAFEFNERQKEPSWFLIGGFLAIILLIIAVFTKNFLFALIIILSAFSLFVWAQKQPRKIRFKIGPRGIIADKVLYEYENLKSFWVFYEPPEIKYLSIESKKLLMPKIILPLSNQNPDKIRDILLKYLPEKEQHESVIDALGRYLRY